MRDLKANSSGKFRTGKARVKANRKKKQKQPLPLRRILHRGLRLVVAGFSVALMVVGVALLLQLLIASDMFRIDRVNVAGGEHLNQKKILALSNIQSGVSTFALDLDLIGRKIEENPWVRSARVERIFPRQVNIHVVERKPQAIINLGYLYYLDHEGEIFKVLGPHDNFDYPVVTGFDRKDLLEKPKQGRARLMAIVTLVEDLEQRAQFGLDQISEVHQGQNGNLTLFTLSGGVKIKLGEGNLAAKLDRLERIYARLKPRLGMLDYIDLNVDKRIIVRIERQTQPAAG